MNQHHKAIAVFVITFLTINICNSLFTHINTFINLQYSIKTSLEIYESSPRLRLAAIDVYLTQTTEY